MRIPILLVVTLTILITQPVFCAESFKDVPKDHWAADSVQMVATDGVMKGYPDTTFKGDKPVTRYELAVALGNMIEFIEQSLGVESQKSKVESPPLSLSKPQAALKADPAQSLKNGGFIPANSPLLTNRDKTVSPTELAQALASVASKLIEKTIPPPKE